MTSPHPIPHYLELLHCVHCFKCDKGYLPPTLTGLDKRSSRTEQNKTQYVQVNLNCDTIQLNVRYSAVQYDKIR